MTISSRTPEGDRCRCNICRKTFTLSVSTYPCYDVTCPHCGCHQFLSSPIDSSLLKPRQFSAKRTAEIVLDILDSVYWFGIATIAFVAVLVNDHAIIPAIFWLVAIAIYRFQVLLFTESISSNSKDDGISFWLGVAAGWAFVAGVPTGILLGSIVPIFESIGISSNQGAMLGLVLGPALSACMGLTLASIVNLYLWLRFRILLSNEPT